MYSDSISIIHLSAYLSVCAIDCELTCGYRCVFYVHKYHIYLQFTQSALNNGGVEPKAKSLQQLPQKIDQYTLFLFKVFYDTKAEAEDGHLDSILCNDFIVDSSRVSIERTESNVTAVMISGIFLPPSS